jgi:hypothetical protein
MRNIIGILSLALLAVLAATAPSQAAPWTNAQLRGCYSFLASTVDTESAPRNHESVGTLCFDGAGHITHAATPFGISGEWNDNNGTFTQSVTLPGTYSINNIPGDGMGMFHINTTCPVYALSLNSIDNQTPPMAHGFQFSLEARNGVAGCPNPLQPFVEGGTAYYQAP